MPCYKVVPSIIPSTESCPYRVDLADSFFAEHEVSPFSYYSKNSSSFLWSQVIYILHTCKLHSSLHGNFSSFFFTISKLKSSENYIHMTWILSFFGVFFSENTNWSIVCEYRLTQIFRYNQITLFILHNSLLSNRVLILIWSLSWVSIVSISLGMWLFQILTKMAHWLILTIFYEFSIPKFQALLYLSYKYFQSC